MSLDPNSGSNSADAPKEPRVAPPSSDAERREHIITAKDAGWITPTAFVLPLTFVPVDPPRPIKKAPPPAS